MTTVAIDTLAAMRKLEKVGFKTEQAEAVAEVMANQSSELATKADIAGLRREMDGLEKSLKGDIAGVRGEIAGLRWMFGLHFAFTLVMLGFLFAIWRDVTTLTAGG